MADIVMNFFEFFGLNNVPATLQEFFPYFMKCLVAMTFPLYIVDMLFSLSRAFNRIK